jgi:hypothetical protein
VNRHERRQAERRAARKPLPPVAPPRDPDQCDACGLKIAEGVVCRSLFDVRGIFPAMYGHASCIDQVIADRVENRGCTDLGEIGGGPRPEA